MASKEHDIQEEPIEYCVLTPMNMIINVLDFVYINHLCLHDGHTLSVTYTFIIER